jgi:hypothetical protein
MASARSVAAPLVAGAASGAAGTGTHLRDAGTDAGNLAYMRRQEVLSVLGLGLIGGSALLLDKTLQFPGWWALLPTAGACLLIHSRGSRLNRIVLSHPLMVGIGLISYPLYLWHWVLLSALQRYSLWHASRLQVLASLAASFLLAWLTYKFIELPVRSLRVKIRKLATFAVFVAALGEFIDVTDGATFRFPPDIQRLANFDYDAHTVYREGSCQLGGEQSFSELAPQCIDPPDGHSVLLVLWGDSHASSLYPGLRAAQAQRGDFRIAQFTASGCPPLLGVRLGPGKACLEFNEAAFTRIKALRPGVVVMEGSWVSYARRAGNSREELSALQRTVGQLTAAGIPRVVVFGSLPIWKLEQPNVGFRVWQESHFLPSRTYAYYDFAASEVDSLVAAAVDASGAMFVSPIDSFCDKNGCLISTDPSIPTPVTWDYAHLTADGSKLLISMNAAKIFGDADHANISPSMPAKDAKP